MNLIGAFVKHKVFGIGEVIKIWENNGRNYIDVRFGDTQRTFGYAKQFLEFFEISDVRIRKDAEVALAKQLEAEELERQKEAEARELMRKKREEAEAQLRNEFSEKRRTKSQGYGIQKNGKHSRSATDKNIIFKCVLCDGGKTDSCVGFRGICSTAQIQYNLGYHKTGWCNHPNNLCRKYLDGEITVEELDLAFANDNASICYEANLFTGWQYAAGVDADGPRTIGRDVSNRLCILTTQLNDNRERYIFGLFLVKKHDEGDNIKEGRVYAHPKYRIALTESEMLKMPLSKYYDTDWRQGLFRYTNDNVAKAILNDLGVIIQDSDEKKLIDEFYAEFCIKNNLEP